MSDGRGGHYAAKGEYLDHRLECPHCGTIRLNIPRNAQSSTPIHCAECGAYLGTWDEIQTDFERQGGTDGVFRLASGRIRRLA
ncbi:MULTISPECIES: hypothetical protein [unclassified Mesorhizobium]|uniref:hypothetical protein n=1 Tax=unclassified Mesorhizobium TaxID=325217 RepID=UPI000F75ED7B|nr:MULTISPECIES: hypothetical protein [unclassified Mesorhizobium]AZO15333.1 hypothetical protein EJ069_11715 [Mesorhizobium sp. M2A.F.Ca.ET.043.05.1.1]RUX34422.1 hypothetical protein EOA23_02420 [Mesorhizobium sp. M2A.F.Ca.ET.042.01.1.1]RWD62533.1 MAG: hypothetical protein EOS37_30765 [Mesorhizobium sp.]RWE72533.1 MAG: hypothetical protein EOS42_22995 [Mesorhizobium sp.]TIV27457.1 MAG: hypothetical protein E5V90_19905 [Mesorhizobium sp.]